MSVMTKYYVNTFILGEYAFSPAVKFAMQTSDYRVSDKGDGNHVVQFANTDLIEQLDPDRPLLTAQQLVNHNMRYGETIVGIHEPFKKLQ